MASCASFDIDGVLRMLDDSVCECQGFILMSATEYRIAFQTLDITAGQITTVFSTVFGWVILLGALSYKIKVAKLTVRKI